MYESVNRGLVAFISAELDSRLFGNKESMEISTSIPVSVYPGEGIAAILETVNRRIARRAYEIFVERGSVDGHSLEDWLDAERDLVIRATPEITLSDEDITIEVLLPTLDMPNVAVHIAPRQFLLSSDIDEEGFQICQVIDLPCEVSMDGVDAEQNRSMIRITAALAKSRR